MKELYQRSVDLDESLHSTLRPFQAVGEVPLSEKVNELGGRFNRLREYYMPNKIYFDESLQNSVACGIRYAQFCHKATQFLVSVMVGVSAAGV